MQASTVSQEPTNPFGFVSQLGYFVSSRLNPRWELHIFVKFLVFRCQEEVQGCGFMSLSTKDGVPTNGVVSDAPKKVLILMSDTGGGHRASAEAIRAAFNEEFGDDYQPDIIISVHPLMQHVPLRILRAKGLLKKIVFTTVVTDLSTCHPTWFHKLVTRCYCPSEEVAKRALRAGLQRSQIKVYGLPVRPSFVKPVRPKDELRKDLGMDEHLPAVLLMGGGEGMGPIEATARALGDALYDETHGEPIGQVLVICGRNKKLANKLQSINWKIPVEVKGFVSKMEECMGACDCIITKAGPGTIAEAMIRGLPIILNDYIAGQEAGNVPYVVQNGCGKFSKSPKEIANIVSQWFGPKQDELVAMSQNSLRLARPDAVFKIVHDLHELVRQRNFVPQYCTT
ncbi:putative monogalactosyldiacylglycerol synthase, chloroplastic [Sesamum angolense]|uniref:monogalactosyldiacylglycerol synthase n=1 Tax=Sesamum angolense TaxID=2727404 RepID=A0AAE1W909_9LAMI|nr:putative monogalactosyldiacylglycerol synthase, chloroplastic [Sesamum angolense]